MRSISLQVTKEIPVQSRPKEEKPVEIVCEGHLVAGLCGVKNLLSLE